MQKKTTQKNFMVFLLKTVLPVLFLSVCFKVACAQNLSTTGKKKISVSEKSAVTTQPVLTKEEMIKAKMEGSSGQSNRTGWRKSSPKAATSATTAPKPALRNELNREEMKSLMSGPSYTDIPAMNKTFASRSIQNQIINNPELVCTFNGSLVTGDATLTNGRFFRDGIPSTCAAPKACGGPFGTGPYFYDTYTFTNPTSTIQCVTVGYTANAGGGDVFGVTYLGSFDPTNLCTNYLADGGSSSLSGGAGVSYSFNVPANATIVVVLMGAQIGVQCPSYTMTIDNLLGGCCVDPTLPTVTGSTSVCPGGSTTLTANGSLNSATDWNWYSGSCGGTLVGTGRTITVSPAANTTYYVRGEGGCVTPGACTAVPVTITSGPTASVLSHVGGMVCTGSTTNLRVAITGGVSPYSVVINAAPGGNFTVNNYISGTNIPITPAVTTTYSLVSVTSANGCVGTGNSGTPIVTVSATTITPIQITADPDAPLCAGDPTLLTVEGAGGLSTLCSSGAISIPVGGNASPYPSNLTVGGMPATGVNVQSVIINGFSHTWSEDVDVLLQSPTGQNVILMSDVGGGNITTNATYTFTDAGPLMTTGPIPTGTYRPTNLGATDNFPAPGPGSITQAAPALSMFGNTADVNGVWKLFVLDDDGIGDQGSIAGGFCIIFNVPPAPPPTGWTFLWSPALGLSSTTGNPVAASPMQTTTYTVVGTAPNGCQTSATKTVVVYGRPAVTANPSDAAACDGASASFTVAATGQGITYQWQESTNGGTSYNNITNGGIYSGATSATLNLSGVTIFMNNNMYRCQISGACPPAVNSTGATLTVNGLPVIEISPASPVCGGVAGINGTLLTAGSAPPPVPGSQTFTSGTINVPIPEGNFPTPPATAGSNVIAVSGIPANATITNVHITSNITHAFVGDVVMVVKAPNGEIFNLDALLNKTNNAGVDFVNTVISSAGTTLLSAGTAPWTGTFKADAVGATFTAFGFTLAGGPTGFTPTTQSWSALYGTPNGNWTIAAYDAGAPDVGTLTNWKITIDYTTPGVTAVPLTYTWSPAAGLYTDANASIPYIAGTQTDRVYAAPAVNTVYTVTGTNGNTGCVNTGTITVVYTPAVPTVTPASVTMCLGDPAVKLQIASSLAPSPFTASYASGPLTLVVTDNTQTGVTSTINAALPATAQITDMTVAFNMNHTWAGDVVVALKAPNNNVLNLDFNLSGSGGTGPTTGFTNTRISSSGTAALSSGSDPYTGVFKADANNSAAGSIAGMPPTGTSWTQLYGIPNGDWSLLLYDAAAGDEGTLTSWSLSFNYLYGVPASGIWSPVAGLYRDAAATIPYTGDTANCLYTLQTASGLYPYQVTVESVGPDALPVFSNTTPITINSSGTATPYSADISVTGLPVAGVSVASVTLNGMNHTWASDVDVLLQSPGGQNVILMSDVGGNVAIPANAVYTFSDAGPDMAAAANASGTYHPTNLVGTLGVEPDNWPAPGPGTVTQAAPALSMFTGDMNGDWKLFIVDDAAGDGGDISGGYSIQFRYPTSGCTSAPRTVNVRVNDPLVVAAQPVNRTVCTDKVATFTIAVTGSGPYSYQWQVSTNNGNTWSNISNGGVYSGATSATLTVSAPPVSMNGSLYRVNVQGALPCPAITSFQVTLTVNPLPVVVISANPFTRLFPGLTTTISSSVTPNAAAPGGYAWTRNGVPVGSST
ncbi:MAG: hypothetical protein WBP16_12415, partial [Ferruginibacter sp.]